MPLISANRHDEWNARQWLGFKPPRDWGDTFRLGFKQAWNHTILQQGLDNFNRSSDISRIAEEHERNKEIISPEQAIEEYPNSAKVIKKPVTRAEAMYWAREQEERDRLAMAFLGKYMGTMPQWTASTGGALGANLLDPVNYVIGIASYGATLGIPFARTSMAMSYLVNNAAKSRLASAAFMSLDGAIGGAIAGAVAKPLYMGSEIKYGLGEWTADILASSAFGTALGGLFPRIAKPQMPLLGIKNTADYISAMLEMKKALAHRGSQDILDIMGSQGGYMSNFINIGDAVSAMAGRRRQKEVRYPTGLDEPARRRVKETEVEFIDRGGLKKRTFADRLQDFSEFAAQARSGYVKVSNRFTQIGIGQGGIISWKGKRFGRPKRFYKADMEANPVPPPRSLERGTLFLNELYIPYTKGEIGGMQSGTKHYGATTPEEAAHIYGLSNPDVRIDVGKIRFNPKKPLHLFNLEDKNLFQNFRLVRDQMNPAEAQTFTAKNIEQIEKAGSWAKVPEPLKVKVMKALRKHPAYDGVGYRRGGKGAWIAELSNKGFGKVSEFSDKYLSYDLRQANPDPKYVRDMVTGKHPDSVPPAIQNLMEEYYAAQAIEDVNYFDTFVKRRSPFSEDTFQDGSAPMEVQHGDIRFSDTDSFTGPGFAETLRKVVKGVVAESVEGTTTSPRLKLGQINSVRDAINAVPKDRLPLLRTRLMQAGFKFPEAIPYNFRSDRVFFTANRVVLPKAKGLGNVLLRAFNDPKFDGDVLIALPGRTLDLSVHPSVMTPEELNLALGLVEDGRIPEVSEINRQTIFTGAKQDILNRAWNLKNMRVSKVKFRHAKGEMELDVGGEAGNTTVANLRTGAENLAVRWAQPVEGQTVKPNERIAEYRKLFSNFQGDLRSSYFTGLVRDTISKVSGIDSVGALEKAQVKYLNLIKELDGMKAGSPAYLEQEGKIRQMESSFRKMNSMVETVAASNIADAQTRLGKWFQRITLKSEVTGLLHSSIDSPYWALGGDNIDVTRRSQVRKYHTALLRGLEEIGGSDPQGLVWMFQSGVFDEDLLKIKHYRMKKREQSQGLSGKLKEQTEELEVSSLAWKVYDHLESVMQGLQKELNDSGFYRQPRFDYIGTRFYDLRTIRDTDPTEFVKDLVAATDMEEAAALNFYNDLRESHTIVYKDRNRPIGDVADKLVHSRKIKFNDAKAEFEFLKKYGGLKEGFSDTFISKSDPRGGSAIYTGAITSIHRDSNLMAINSFLGSRPLLTLDLMFGAIAKKARTDIADGARVLAQSDTQFKRSQRYAENMLDAIIFEQRVSFSKWAEMRKVLRAMTNVGKLVFSLPKIVAGDFTTSAANLMKLTNPGRKGSDNLFSTSLQLLSNTVKKLPPSTRMEVGRRFNTLLSLDTRNFAGRFANDPAGVASWMESLAMRGYGIGAATDMSKTSNSTFLGHWLSESFNLPWNRLRSEIQDKLTPFGMTEETWNTVRSLPNLREDFDGVSLVFLDRLGTAIREHGEKMGWTDKKVMDTYRMFDSFFYHLSEERGVPMQGVFEKAFWNLDRHNPDSLIHNVGMMVEQFKSIGMAVARSLAASMADSKPGHRAEFRLQRIAPVVVYSTVMGAMALQAQNLLKGRTAQDMDTQEFWLDSMAQGGATWLLGDLMLSDFTHGQAGLRKFLLGPTLGGTIPDGIAVGQHSVLGLLGREDEFEKAGQDLKRVIRGALPGIPFGAHGLILNTLLLRQLGALSDTWISKDFETRRMKEAGYDYWAR